jgi:antitoxin HicB
MKTTDKRDLAYYMALPYTKTLRLDSDGDVVAKILELPGCSAHGENEQEALIHLEEAQCLWLEDCLDVGDPVPQPECDEPLPSGKWVQRVPRSLHSQLTKAASREGVSLNQFVTSVLAQSLSAGSAQRVLEESMTRLVLSAIHSRSQVHHWGGAGVLPTESSWVIDSLPHRDSGSLENLRALAHPKETEWTFDNVSEAKDHRHSPQRQ